MAPDERPSESTGPPNPIAFTITDPCGRTVWMDQASLDFKASKHPELQRSPEWTAAAIEDPDLIARHASFDDRRIYVGEARAPGDPTYAPTRRILIVNSSTPPGEMITGYDKRGSRLPATVGEIEWKREP